MQGLKTPQIPSLVLLDVTSPKRAKLRCQQGQFLQEAPGEDALPVSPASIGATFLGSWPHVTPTSSAFTVTSPV